MQKPEAHQTDVHVIFMSQCFMFYVTSNKVIATACMFLAGKVEETPKALSDLLKVSLAIKYRGEEAARVLTGDVVRHVFILYLVY